MLRATSMTDMRLLGTLGRNAQRVDLAPQHIALHQVAHEALVDLLPGVHLMMLNGADRLGLAPNGVAFLGGGPAGIDVDGMDPRPGLGQAGDAVRGIQPAGEGQGDSLHTRYLCNHAASRNPVP